MITLEDVGFSYDQRNTFRFSLKVTKGEKLWIHGPSGAGKSTLFKLLLGFVQPNSGNILVAGEELHEQSMHHIRQKMSFVPQQINLGRSKVWDVFKEVFSFKSNRHLKLNREKLLQHFENFGLDESLLHQSFDDLSGGERQRVAIILALSLKREILLLDEALSAIDQKQRKLILNELAQMDQTVLLIAHDKPQQEAFRPMDFNQIKNQENGSKGN